MARIDRQQGKASSAQPLRRLDEALSFVKETYTCVCSTEQVPVAGASGCILAENIIAPVDLPRFDAAAVDGIAVRTSDLRSGVTNRFHLIGRAAAGHPFTGTVSAMGAVRIFTGAPVPAGCDSVIMQEDCLHKGDWVFVEGKAGQRANIRRQGEDVASGAHVLHKGQRLSPTRLALVSALGLETVPAFRPLRVTVFSSGDELAATRDQGQIADANRPLLMGFLRASHCSVTDGGILPDDADQQVARLMQAALASDLIVTTGGMSEGEEDHMPSVIRRRGFLEVWKLRVKPGKPVGIGDIDDCPILALPGNPVAAAVIFTMLGLAMIERLSGLEHGAAARLGLPLGAQISKKKGRWEAMPVALARNDAGQSIAMPMPKQGSAMLGSLAGCDGFVALPEEMEHADAGDRVEFHAFPAA